MALYRSPLTVTLWPSSFLKNFTPNAPVLFVDVAIQPEVRFIAKQNSLMKIGNNGNLVLGPLNESTPCLMIVLMNCQTKLRINHLTAVKSVAVLERRLWLAKHVPGKRARRHFSQLSEFERGLIIRTKTADWSTRRLAGQVDRLECAVRNCWEQWTREGTHARKTVSGATRKTTRREDRRIVRQALVDPTVTRSTIRADVGIAIVPQTITRHLAEANLKSKRPFRALPLTPEHRQLRLQWCQARSMWNDTDWQKVVFSDESQFVLGTDDNRTVYVCGGALLRKPCPPISSVGLADHFGDSTSFFGVDCTAGRPLLVSLLTIEPPPPETSPVAAVAEWYTYQIVACLVTSSSPVPLKTHRVGQRCTLNLSRAETSSRWCGVVVRRGGCQLRCRPRHLTMVQNYVVCRQKPSCS
ncbi:transposable element Tc1 transposase [Trichonephila clavipes]|nr:transposable element Tc1 transposase [Trichonephila clavipes]